VKTSQGKILVIRGGAIGDFILTLPAIAALRQQFPRAHLEVLGYPHIINLAVAGGLVDRAQSIEAAALAAFFGRGSELAEHMVDYFSEFDLIISYLYDPDEIFRTNIARCTPAQFIAGPHRPDEQAGLSAAKAFLKPLERLAIFDADHVPRLKLRSPEARAEPGPMAASGVMAAEPLLAIHPGSGSETKNWPEEKWAELIQELLDRTNYRLLVVGGEAEGERLQRLAAALPPRRARVAQSFALPELARALQGAAAFLGHDSGITHLAAALGVPCLILWSHTSEEIWRPPGEKVVIARHPQAIQYLEVSTVVQQFEKLCRLALFTS
jgi:heptosyltransferase-2